MEETQTEKEECGSYTNKITVTNSKNMLDVIDIKAGKNNVIALKSTGEIYVSGTNYGISTDRQTNKFIKVEGLNQICMITAGTTREYCIKLNWKNPNLGRKRIWRTRSRRSKSNNCTNNSRKLK